YGNNGRGLVDTDGCSRRSLVPSLVDGGPGDDLVIALSSNHYRRRTRRDTEADIGALKRDRYIAVVPSIGVRRRCHGRSDRRRHASDGPAVEVIEPRAIGVVEPHACIAALGVEERLVNRVQYDGAEHLTVDVDHHLTRAQHAAAESIPVVKGDR